MRPVAASCCAVSVRPAAGLISSWTVPTKTTRRLALDLGYRPVVPTRSNRRWPHHYDREVYRRRNEVERFFCRLKRFQRIDTRCDKLEVNFLAAIHLVPIYDMISSI